MASAWVLAIPVGQHHTAQGVLDATAKRVRGWVSTVQEQIANGVRLPVCWSHVAAAMPWNEDDPEAARLAGARYNAGYIRDARIGTDGGVELQVDVPGAEVDRDGNLLTTVELPGGCKVRGAIGEVSCKLAPSWRDGKGRVWKDSIAHLALVPLPVVMSQKGFVAEKAAGGVYLSTTTLARGQTVRRPVAKAAPNRLATFNLAAEESVPGWAAWAPQRARRTR
jgi:hypothetical protein